MRSAKDSSRIINLLVSILIVGACLSRAYAQIPKATLRGKIVDPAGAPIAGARITVSREGLTSANNTVADGAGEFFLALEPGEYTLRVATQGFLETYRTVTLKDSGAESVEIALQIATQRDTVTVIDTDSYQSPLIASGTKTLTKLHDIPQSITVVTREQIKDQQMLSIGDVVRYTPGITAHQGENNRDQIIFRGNSSSADFFLNGMRDDVQYYRDLYNLDRVEVLRGPNAMIFGRGGGGGVINRVTKEAGFTPLREISLLAGSFNNKRVTMDFDRPYNDKVAFRANGVYENSKSFRNRVDLERYGVNPTLTFTPGNQTKITFSYEHFVDTRVADRGVSSYQGRPLDIDISTYFGNPDDSNVWAYVNLGTATVEHEASRWTIRNRTQIGDYDRGYQNFVPGAVNADQTQAALTAYNNSTARRNIFNQTDATYTVKTGPIGHTLLGGAEFGLQLTDNFRNTGFFNNLATSITVPLSNPTISVPVAFRQNATDADNHLETNIAAAYVQDQIELSRRVQVVAGVRFDRFDLQYFNNRNGDQLSRVDDVASPRVGAIFKPIEQVSIYGNYSVSYLPSSGDQFSSLTTITQQVKPEKFKNYEGGLKWDVNRFLTLTSAVFRLDRTNTRSTDPNDPTRIVQTGSQRANGFEFGLSGSPTHAWRIAGGYAYQDAFITSATTAAPEGAQVAQVPHHNFSLWNNYQILPRLGAGLGVIHRSDMFATIDDTVTLPGHTRADVAVFFSITERIRLQVNVENLFDRKYFVNADSNTNISPGYPRAVRVGLTARF
ncbi:MAG: TonB-dependent siderophore receptor [Chloracidobacterium sp.]|nr:TonB-dependent siderophore receptor [Chloracidobacterium sp.]